jgi:purine-binding chemotaxis protein CheW
VRAAIWKQSRKLSITLPARAMRQMAGDDREQTMSTVPSGKDPSVEGRGGKFLTFFLAGEEYGLEILKVQEIIGMQPITRVPRTPEFVRGVINLRGKVIPIMDLRRKFGMPDDLASDSCIIVVQVRGTQIGVVVDRVSEVAAIASSDIEAPPSFGDDIQTDYLLGLGKSQGGVKLLLDIDRVLDAEELASLPALSAQLAQQHAVAATS